jgi:hypothetical protein
LYCTSCESLFKLTRSEMRSCKCKHNRVRGQYTDREQAKISQNPKTISIAIDNDSLKAAIGRMRWWLKHRPESTREDYTSFSSLVAWVRPNSGPGNPHSDALGSKLKTNASKRKR